jgi:hypothetical protein
VIAFDHIEAENLEEVYQRKKLPPSPSDDLEK